MTETLTAEGLEGAEEVLSASDFRMLMSRKANPYTWVGRTEPLEDIRNASGSLKGDQRCAAIGLIRGSCSERRSISSIYCYYHDKVRSGLITVYPDLYPVWPLPEVPWDFGVPSVRESA